MKISRYAERRETLRARMHAAGLSALLVSLDANRFYLSGFELHDPQPDESSGCLVIMQDGRDWLCTDPRFEEAAARLWDAERIFIYRGNRAEQLNGLLRKTAGGPVGFEARTLTVDFFEHLSPGLEFQKADGLVEQMRLIKDAEEIAAMEASCALNHRLMDWLPGVLAPGRTEAQVAWDIEQFFRNHGAQELSFASIVAFDANAALPHAVPGGDVLGEGACVLVDVGCRLADYCSDQTRTFWVGENPPARFSDYLAWVREAQESAINAIRPGVCASEIYAVARARLAHRGVAERFTHGLGHGIGLQTHEAPSLGPRSDVVLEPGMVVTVEPGVYYGGDFGIRWEYMVLVTGDGCRVF